MLSVTLLLFKQRDNRHVTEINTADRALLLLNEMILERDPVMTCAAVAVNHQTKRTNPPWCHEDELEIGGERT